METFSPQMHHNLSVHWHTLGALFVLFGLDPETVHHCLPHYYLTSFVHWIYIHILLNAASNTFCNIKSWQYSDHSFALLFCCCTAHLQTAAAARIAFKPPSSTPSSTSVKIPVFVTPHFSFWAELGKCLQRATKSYPICQTLYACSVHCIHKINPFHWSWLAEMTKRVQTSPTLLTLDAGQPYYTKW